MAQSSHHAPEMILSDSVWNFPPHLQPLLTLPCLISGLIICPRYWTGFVYSLASSSPASNLPPVSFQNANPSMSPKPLDGFSLPSR